MQIIYIVTDYGTIKNPYEVIKPIYKHYRVYKETDYYVIEGGDDVKSVKINGLIKDINEVKEQKCYISVQYMLSNLWSK